MVQTLHFRKKEKKEKSILVRFKGIKNAGWYSLSFLILDALRKHARPLKSNFMVFGKFRCKNLRYL